MGTTDIRICNIALSYVGVSEQISMLTEKGIPAEQCNLHYADAVQLVFEDCHWPELTGYSTLGLVQTDPSRDWKYSYRWPPNCLAIRRILTDLGREDPNPPEFRNGGDDQGLLVYANCEDVQVEFTINRNNPQFFSATLADAISWKLAEKVAPALTRMEDREKHCASMYNMAISKAKARSLNQQQSPRESDAEHIQARG